MIMYSDKHSSKEIPVLISRRSLLLGGMAAGLAPAILPRALAPSLSSRTEKIAILVYDPRIEVAARLRQTIHDGGVLTNPVTDQMRMAADMGWAVQHGSIAGLTLASDLFILHHLASRQGHVLAYEGRHRYLGGAAWQHDLRLNEEVSSGKVQAAQRGQNWPENLTGLLTASWLPLAPARVLSFETRGGGRPEGATDFVSWSLVPGASG